MSRWIEPILFLSIVLVCILGSCGHFDAKAEEPIPVVEEPIPVASCEKWVEVPQDLRVKLLRFRFITELRKADLTDGTESLIDCLSEIDNMKLLDNDIVAECDKGGEEFLANVFDKSLERIVFRCLKWVNEEKK